MQMVLLPRHTLPDATTSPARSHCATLYMDAEESPGASTKHAIHLPWDEDRKAFCACLVIPRVVALDIVARRHASAPWEQLLQLQVCMVCDLVLQHVVFGSLNVSLCCCCPPTFLPQHQVFSGKHYLTTVRRLKVDWPRTKCTDQSCAAGAAGEPTLAREA
jgi:hypothetical protein